MAPKHKRPPANRFLVLEDIADADTRSLRSSENQETGDKVDHSVSFKRWLRLFWPRKSQQTQRYVEGWLEDAQGTVPPYHVVQEQQWECLSGYSSQLGTVKTTSLDIASQCASRSRGTTQSTGNRSSSSEIRRSNEMHDLRPTISIPLIEQESHKRAIKRREVIHEILSTEADYVLGLKALIGVFVSLYIFGFGCQFTNRMRFSGSFHVFN